MLTKPVLKLILRLIFRLACTGCGKAFTRLRSEINKSLARGKKNPYCSMKCLAKYRRGPKHPAWKFDDISYTNLHAWVRRNLLMPRVCEICQIYPPRDLANITGVYDRHFLNWKYMCKACHFKYDRGY